MSVDFKEPFGRFLRLSISECRANLRAETRNPTADLNAKMLEEEIDRAHEAWHRARKPKRKKPIADDAAWIASLKADPAMAGVDVDKEIAKCQFWCRNQEPPIKASRRRIVNWLNKADRVLTAPPLKRDMNAEPAGFREWYIRTRMGGADTYKPWAQLSSDTQKYLLDQMSKEP
jgi:hypothetical protein